MTLITDEYKKLQEELHAKGNYGVTGGKYAALVSDIVNKLEVTHLLDYGCSKNLSLLKALKVNHKLKYQAYDPAVEAYSTPPVAAEMVVCTDVLEHIEPELLDNVLDHLAQLTEAVAFISIHTGPAGKELSDGRNAHLTQQPYHWWLPRLIARFDLHSFQVVSDHEFYVVLYARGVIEDASGQKVN
jgi:hypothetical protein